MATMTGRGQIRVGIGGWNYAPWRETFYQRGTPQSRELEFASRHVTSIEINGTFYRLQKPSVFSKWYESTPEEFMFSIKAPRFIVQRKDLSTAGSAVERFVSSGIAQLKEKLGPILWQLSPTKRFDSSEIDAFLTLLPPSAGDLPMRHAIQVNHSSFMNSEFLALARKHAVAMVLVDDDTHPGCADLTSTFVYARLRRSAAPIVTGYPLDALERWAGRAQTWAQGKEPADLPRIAPETGAATFPRDVFVYVINGAKERAPAAAQQLLSLLG